MTVVAALLHEGKVWMGADSLSTFSDGTKLSGQEKLWIRENSGESWLFGSAGNKLFGQMVRYEADLPSEKPGDNLLDYLVTKWAHPFREKVADRKGLLDNDGKIRGGGEVLIGLRGQLFLMVGFGIFPVREPFRAIGIGEGPAFGVLHFTQGSGLEPEKRLRAAVTAASELQQAVDDNCYLLSV